MLFPSSLLPGEQSLQKRICPVVIFSPKKMSSQYWPFFFLFALDYQTLLEFYKFERQKCFFGIGKALFTFWWYLGVPNNRFQFFFCGIMYFCVSNCDAVFLITNFPYLITVSDWYYHFDVLNFFSFIQFYWVSGRCASEFALECFCLKKIVTNW